MNSATHILGILFGLVCIPILVLNADDNGSPWVVTGAGVYGFSFLMVFTCSTLFHCQKEGRLRHLFKVMDHISIYFLIAGTYTPLILIYVNNSYGIILLSVLWGLTLIGTFFKLYWTGKFEIVSTIIYVIMGWMLLTGADTFFANMPYHIIALIVAGGILYSVGVVFYLWRCFTYHHAVWHLFVLAAGICHYTAILMSVWP